MSRVHDALRRAEMGGMMPPDQPPVLTSGDETEAINPDLRPPEVPLGGPAFGSGNSAAGNSAAGSSAAVAATSPLRLNIHPSMLQDVEVVPFAPAPESHLLDLNNSHETPAEEFRTLRTRLNHLQTDRKSTR